MTHSKQPWIKPELRVLDLTPDELLGLFPDLAKRLSRKSAKVQQSRAA